MRCTNSLQLTTYNNNNIPGSEGLTLLTTADVHSWQFDVVAWDQKDSETTNLQNSMAMLERELLTAATIVTDTTGHGDFLSVVEWKTGSIMRPALRAKTLPLVIRMANDARFVTATTVTHGFGERDQESFNLFFV